MSKELMQQNIEKAQRGGCFSGSAIEYNGKLQFVPIREIKSLCNNPQRISDLVVTETEKEITAGDGVSFEIKMKIDLEKTDAEKFEMDFRCGEGKKTECIFDFKSAEMSVNRSEADGWSRGTSRSVMYLKGKKELDVHGLSDQSSIEIFTDQYQNNHSNNILQEMLKIKSRFGHMVAM